ncbi:von Willebrand factor type A domain protein [Posidoniimonas corsicana]|uniref:von Willebrand factor type A domain protein n=1 Tax=Posidoniimonas corsicana TaxID=1938618 RepID=A0A5C5VCD4_9BACT|nr:VWA domain-containing protein [Posidoniimonas corsicana]TWT35680.1 von Willebrand factor type A domain protein [Posidoniimonas corsicana]
MRYVLAFFVAAMLPTLVPCSPAAQAAMPEVLFILDSSGSMAEDAGGQSKIDAAKRVMRQITPGLPEEVLVGLVAYGHRRPGDCSDIEVLIPAGSSDRQGLMDQVEALQPRGKTPITSAFLTAAEMLKSKDAVTSVVLVSDGVETCGGDPCRVVGELKATGCRFVLHTVGFDVDPAAAKQLSCLAKAGGGQFFAAADGDALLAALREVSRGVAEEVEKAKARTVASGTGLGKLRIAIPPGGGESLAYIEIARASDGKITKTITKPSDQSTHPLVSGDYRVTAGFAVPNYGEPTRSELGVLTIYKQQTRDLPLGSIAFNVPDELVSGGDWKNRLHVDLVAITESGSGRAVVRVGSEGNGYYNFKDKPVLPGVYDVCFQYAGADQPITVSEQVVVKPGERSVVTLDSGIQLVRPEQDVTAWRLFRRADQSAVADEDQGQAPARLLAYEARAAAGLGGARRVDSLYYPYLLPPGVYDLELDVQGMSEPLPVGEAIEIKQGELTRFDSGL